LESPLLSDDGRRWIVRAVDPFHDTQVKPAGFPDFDQSGTVVQEINMSVTIGPPATVTSGSNWDCHVFNMCDFAYNLGTGLTGLGAGTFNPLPVGKLEEPS